LTNGSQGKARVNQQGRAGVSIENAAREPQRGEPLWGEPQGADLTGADLRKADLQAAILLEADLACADLTGCRIYGISAWNLKLEVTKQQSLVITSEDEPEITVDNIKVARFICLMLHNQKDQGRHRHDYLKGGADPWSFHR
jgi:hypothetical protein